MMIKCPSDCRHPYLFQHSVITSSRIEKGADGMRVEVTSTFIVCRECGHWIDGPVCLCTFRCHEDEGGTIVTETPLDVVNCL